MGPKRCESKGQTRLFRNRSQNLKRKLYLPCAGKINELSASSTRPAGLPRHMGTCAHSYTPTHGHTQMRTHMCTHTMTDMHTHRCRHVHTGTHTCAQTCTHRCRNTCDMGSDTCVQTHRCRHTCARGLTHLCTDTHMHRCRHTCTHGLTHVCADTHTHVQRCTHSCAQTRTQTHGRTHMHTRPASLHMSLSPSSPCVLNQPAGRRSPGSLTFVPRMLLPPVGHVHKWPQHTSSGSWSALNAAGLDCLSSVFCSDIFGAEAVIWGKARLPAGGLAGMTGVWRAGVGT